MYYIYIYIHIIRVLPSAVALLIEIFTDALLLTMNDLVRPYLRSRADRTIPVAFMGEHQTWLEKP